MVSLFQACLFVCCLVAVIARSQPPWKLQDPKKGNFSSATATQKSHEHGGHPVATTSDCRDTSKRCKIAAKNERICQSERGKLLCKKTCHVCHLKALSPHISCHDSVLGCCWDGVTTRQGPYDEGCPKCQDEGEFGGLCARWQEHCDSKKPRDLIMRNIVQKYCHLTCGKCGNTRIYESVRRNTLPPISIQESLSDNKPRSGAKYVWTKVKSV